MHLELILEAHTEMLLVVIVLAALIAANKRWVFVSTFLSVLSIAIKPIGVLFLVPVFAHHVWIHRRRAVIPLLAGGTAGSAGLALLYRTYWVGWETLAPLVREAGLYVKSLAAVFVLGLGHDPTVYALVGVILAGLSVIWAMGYVRTFPRLVAALMVLLLVHLLLVTPFYQMWYLTWFLPVVAVDPRVLLSRRWTAGAALCCLTGFWGSYGLQFVSRDQSRNLILWSIVCVAPALLYAVIASPWAGLSWPKSPVSSEPAHR